MWELLSLQQGTGNWVALWKMQFTFIIGEKGFEHLQKQNITKAWRFSKGTNIFVVVVDYHYFFHLNNFVWHKINKCSLEMRAGSHECSPHPLPWRSKLPDPCSTLFSCLWHFSLVLASALRMQMFVLQSSVVSPVCYRVNLEFQSKHLCT